MLTPLSSQVIDLSQNLSNISRGNSKHILPTVNGGIKLNLELSFESQSHVKFFLVLISI